MQRNDFLHGMKPVLRTKRLGHVPHFPSSHSMTSVASAPLGIPSVQELSPGVPRFHVPVLDHPLWKAAAEIEAAGGMDAEVRTFLDSQLETGDVVLDLDAEMGFVALGATTAPGGMPTVFVAGLSAARLQQLQDAAADVGGWVESIDLADPSLLVELEQRLEPDGRLFVHCIADDVARACRYLSSLIESGRVLSVCISDAANTVAWNAAAATLTTHGFRACTLVARDDTQALVPLVGAPTAPVIAVPVTLDHAAGAPPVSASVKASWPSADGWVATRDGFAFQSSHSRTGYGVAGAHLLSALQRRGIPLSYFPIGPVDQSITENAALAVALDAQGTFRQDVPSVRLSQQFDLAQHVGRGPRVGFTIFELDTFTPRELHHLRSQDALIVCSEWARDVCVQNGVTSLPIHVVPLGVDRTVFHDLVAPTRRWTETVFMQVGKLEPRKGQRELLRAFEAAFTTKDAVRLVLACRNPFVSTERMNELTKPFRTSPMAQRISLMTTELPTQRDVAALMAGADCGVFAARAEGWNLEALEMLALGKTVIATNCTAHTAYLNDTNARLIEMDGLEPAHRGAATGRWSAWGEAQHEQLVAHMRAVHATRQTLGPITNEAGLRTADAFTWDSSAEHLLRALETLP